MVLSVRHSLKPLPLHPLIDFYFGVNKYIIYLMQIFMSTNDAKPLFIASGKKFENIIDLKTP